MAKPVDTPRIIDPQKFGVSFSVKQCRSFGIDPKETMRWLIEQAGFRRFRLMSYWNEHEKQPGVYDFSQLDWQIELARRNGCLITLCLGARQPRWPENHWPKWAWEAPKNERSRALLRYIEAVVQRYKDYDHIVSYQLENEALLKAFGEKPEVDRARLRSEYNLVKRLDPHRPVIMTTSTSWGIPMRKPVPDIVGFSFYRILYGQGRYHHAFHFPMLDRARALGIQLFHAKPSFVHELQLEPWGPTAIWKMQIPEQDKSMGTEHIKANVRLAKRTNLYPIDIWGGEWWYWRLKVLQDPTTWVTVSEELRK
ncbi:MAG TPA: cellulase family glycosylhydrolase [Candidatus Saccharimonadales bacterium]|nr:cellulase family glycosylhydrolase [Candidatus Saccharimonadales bacterium]